MASWIARRRWEWREQAIAGLVAQSEAMTGSKKRGNTQATAAKPATTERVFRTNHGGVNHGPPPLTALQKVGLEIEGKGF